MPESPRSSEDPPPIETASLEAHQARPLAQRQEMPVVARLVIEVRSDGIRTSARGAMEDVLNDHQTAIELPAMTPLQLSAALSATLTKALAESPGLAREALRSLVPAPIRRLKRRILGQEPKA